MASKGSYTIGAGYEDRSHMQVTAADIAGGDYQRIVNQQGSPVVGRAPRNDDLIVAGGVQMTVRMARNLGLIEIE